MERAGAISWGVVVAASIALTSPEVAASREHNTDTTAIARKAVRRGNAYRPPPGVRVIRRKNGLRVLREQEGGGTQDDYFRRDSVERGPFVSLVVSAKGRIQGLAYAGSPAKVLGFEVGKNLSFLHLEWLPYTFAHYEIGQEDAMYLYDRATGRLFNETGELQIPKGLHLAEVVRRYSSWSERPFRDTRRAKRHEGLFARYGSVPVP